MKLLPVTLLSLAFCLPAASLAQWQWIDPSGRKVYSDRPPPPEISPEKILRRPGGKGGAAAMPATEPASAPAAPTKAAASAPKLTGKEKELEEKRKQAEAAEADKKKAEEQKLAQARAENCTRARNAKTTLDSGQRMARTSSSGEVEILDDAARAAEGKRLDGIIASDCKQ